MFERMYQSISTEKYKQVHFDYFDPLRMHTDAAVSGNGNRYIFGVPSLSIEVSHSVITQGCQPSSTYMYF